MRTTLAVLCALLLGGCEVVQDAAVDAALSDAEQAPAEELVNDADAEEATCSADVFGLADVSWGSVSYLQFDKTVDTTVTLLVEGLEAELTGFLQLSRQGAFKEAPEASGAMWFDVDIKTTGTTWKVHAYFDWQRICDPRQVDVKVVDEEANSSAKEPYSYYFESDLKQDEEGTWWLGGTLWLEMDPGTYTAFADIDRLARTH